MSFRFRLADSQSGSPATRPVSTEQQSRSRLCVPTVDLPYACPEVTRLFRRSEEKAAREEAGRVEFERLMALPVADLARELMPGFGPDGLQPSHGRDSGLPASGLPAWGINLLQLVRWVSKTYCPSGATKTLAPSRASARRRLPKARCRITSWAGRIPSGFGRANAEWPWTATASHPHALYEHQAVRAADPPPGRSA